MGLSQKFAELAAVSVSDIVHQSGGSILEPKRHTSEIRDFEDNLIIDLVVAVDALVLVTNDWDLLELNPWNGRLIMTPKEFVSRVVGARRQKRI
jgi:predicted nucleic acid-binding protein